MVQQILKIASVALIGLFASQEGSAQSSQVKVSVRDIQGASHTGVLEKVTPESITLRTKEGRVNVAVQDAIVLSVGTAGRRHSRNSAVVFLANGDRLMARISSIDETHATANWVDAEAWKPVRIPLELIHGALYQVPGIRGKRQTVIRDLLQTHTKTDLVLLHNGDRIAGQLSSVSNSTVTVETAVGGVRTPTDNVRAVVFNEDLVSVPRLNGPRALVTLRDGSWITTTKALSWNDSETVVIPTVLGKEIEVPSESIAEMRFLGGRAVHVSELNPKSFSMKPFLTTKWPLRVNLNVLGSHLKQADREFPLGLGMHTQSEVTYAIDGRFEAFLAHVGIDAAADRRGSVVFSVAVDGEEKFRSQNVTGRDALLPVGPIELKGAKTITLRAEFGEFADIRDYANWYDAVFVKSSAE